MPFGGGGVGAGWPKCKPSTSITYSKQPPRTSQPESSPQGAGFEAGNGGAAPTRNPRELPHGGVERQHMETELNFVKLINTYLNIFKLI